ncbi:isoprenoid biosynthesis glyoxalase ElbB [Shewanella sp. WXL01]|uniref:Glyoxalase n=1 Tax=Shewanella maritima TaxID=2520507 RepID=A0A411PHX3_9GAMM|nr:MULTISPECIES: isoprenoid biosynthesis glyoxalase ElbB [Shewanella]NKF52061.1 isoprenoid biosynthesis glyoxalase ElbB [Shewanella sp. WXL01]QBF83143.1 isoprenoid biosynthesis glyoxalase ElbB [Shewanella maritima]
MKKVAVLLSGSGVFDGAEIHESVLTLLAVVKAGASYQCFAPDIAQLHVVNHLTGEVDEGASRNVLVEAARIARGEIKDVTNLELEEFDALIVPGGFGAAKNLCNFALNGKDCTIAPQVEQFIREFALASKPVGMMCIAPVMVPLIYGENVQATIGTDIDTAAAVNQMGATHVDANVDEIVVDEANKLVTTPAYMLATNIAEANEGIEKLVKQVISMA